MNRNILKVEEAPLFKLKKKASGKYSIDLSQAVPGWSMPEEASEYAMGLLKSHNDNRVAFYTPDPGLDKLRRALSDRFNRFYDLNTDKESFIITAGANQAFYNVATAIFNPNEKVVVIEPYYFNHVMTLNMLGVEPETVVCSDDDLNIDIDRLKECVAETRPSAIIIVNPSNPTGKTIRKDTMDQIVDIAIKENIWIISDETYELFVDDFVSLACYRNLKKKIVIGSFSKSYSLTGFRTGYIYCDTSISGELLKAQDCQVICAPRISQEIAWYCMEELSEEWLNEKRIELNKRAGMMNDIQSDYFSVLSAGPFFAYMKGRDKCDKIIEILLDKGILVAPGNMFESNSDTRNIRVSTGNVSEDILKKTIKIMESFN